MSGYLRIVVAIAKAITRIGIRASRKRGCLTREGGGPSEAAIQVEASNHRKLLRSKAVVVSVTGKGETRFCQVFH